MSSPDPSPAGLVVVDLAGTVLDHGCLAPVTAFVRAFEDAGLPITDEEARGPMGLNKLDHVCALLALPRIARAFEQRRGRSWEEEDARSLYEAFLPLQATAAREHAGLVDGVRELCAWLSDRHVAVAATTGYPRSIAAPVLERARAEGFDPVFTACADEVPAGRPAPWLIHRCMEATGVYPPARVVKVGDTVPDVQAALNAGVRAVAVVETGSEVGLDAAGLAALSGRQREELVERAGQRLLAAGAEALLPSIADLPELLERWSWPR